MSKQELSVVNDKIANGELYFYPGVPVEVKLKKAFVTDHSTYIYPIFDDIICLKKETAIVPKNRTQNPLLRVSDQLVDAFYSKYKLRRKDKSKAIHACLPSRKLSNDEISNLRKMLPREGGVLVSACADAIDASHNLKFGLQFGQLVHFDHSFDRIKEIKKEAKKEAILVLGDYAKLPFEDSKIDAFFSFDDMTHYEKDEQKLVYEELKRVLSQEGASIMLYDKDKKLHAESSMKADKMVNKAKSIFKPWKKEKTSFIHFHGVEVSNNQDNVNDSYLSETSLGRQFS